MSYLNNDIISSEGHVKIRLKYLSGEISAQISYFRIKKQVDVSYFNVIS